MTAPDYRNRPFADDPDWVAENGMTEQPGGPLPTGGVGTTPVPGTGSATWQLAEFEAHSKRLNRVQDTVHTVSTQAEEAIAGTRDAYGVLFGWAIMPFLNQIGDATIDFSDKLADAVERSSAAIHHTMLAYADAEGANRQATAGITADIHSYTGGQP
ncbi:hypothetical protein ACQB6R_09220 [Propionibacteriaceae bacterium G1746]